MNRVQSKSISCPVDFALRVSFLFVASALGCGTSAEPAPRETPPPETRDGVGTERPSQLALSVRVRVAPSDDNLVHTTLVAVVRDMDGHESETDLGEFIGQPVDANPTGTGEIMTLRFPEDEEAEALHFIVNEDGSITVFREAVDGTKTRPRRLEMPALGKVEKATPALEHGLDAKPVDPDL